MDKMLEWEMNNKEKFTKWMKWRKTPELDPRHAQQVLDAELGTMILLANIVIHDMGHEGWKKNTEESFIEQNARVALLTCLNRHVRCSRLLELIDPVKITAGIRQKCGEEWFDAWSFTTNDLNKISTYIDKQFQKQFLQQGFIMMSMMFEKVKAEVIGQTTWLDAESKDLREIIARHAFFMRVAIKKLKRDYEKAISEITPIPVGKELMNYFS